MRERPVNPEAHEAYLLSLHHLRKLSRTDIEKGISYFEQAIAEDADYALAHAGLAQAYASLSTQYVAPPGGDATGESGGAAGSRVG